MHSRITVDPLTIAYVLVLCSNTVVH